MAVTHTFVSAKPPAADPTEVGSVEWNATHTVSIVNADVAANAGIVESKLALNYPTQPALTFPLSPTLGGTGVNNGTNALTVPATGTAALLATANIFTATQKIETSNGDNDKLVLNSVTDANAWHSFISYRWANSEKFSIQGTRTTGKYYYLITDISGRVPWAMHPSTAKMGVNFDLSASTPLAQLQVVNNASTDIGLIVENAYSARIDTDIIRATVTDAIEGWGWTVGTVFSIGTAGKLTTDMLTLTDNTVQEVAHFGIRNKDVGGTGANGFGPALGLYAETATNLTYQQQATISAVWIDATNATRKAKLSLSAYDTVARLGMEIEASGTVVKLGFFGGTTAAQQALNAYASDGEGSAYTGIDNAQAGTVYATVADLNQLRVAYETLRASYDDLRTKLQTSTVVA